MKITKHIHKFDFEAKEMSGFFLFDDWTLSKWQGFISFNRVADTEMLAKAFKELIKEHNKLVKKHNELVELVFSLEDKK